MNNNRRVKFTAARRLRKNQTKPEEILWWLLRNRGMLGNRFRRQYIIEGFILDFYCPSAKLGIEIDGPIHKYRRDYDKARQEIIEAKGIEILRFDNSEIYNSPESVLSAIIDKLPSPALSTKWRGGTTSEASGG
jgi:very-short-patch-repair endonuclease